MELEMLESRRKSNYGMSPTRKPEDYNNMAKKRWRKACRVVYFIGIMLSFLQRVKAFGAIRQAEHLNQIVKEKKNKKRRASLPIYPDDDFKIYWDSFLMVLLITIGVITPFRVCIMDDEDQDVWYPFDLSTDLLFGLDMLASFLTAYYDVENKLETRLTKIGVNYLGGWFTVDAIAILPFNLIIQNDESSASTGNTANKLLRLLRLPRLYRLLKIIRFAKMEHTIKNSIAINNFLNKLRISVAVSKLFKILINFLFTCHIVACFWFFTSKFDDFEPDTWVVRDNQLNNSYMSRYVASFHWVFQTLTTVGFGDITALTTSEMVFAIAWMIFGVGMFSFAIGNVGSILSNIDKRESELRSKINQFNDFTQRVKLPNDIFNQIRQFYEVNYRENVYQWIDPNKFMQELPSNIRRDLLLYSYRDVWTNIYLFKIDPNFTTTLFPFLTFLQLPEKTIIYREDDPAEEVTYCRENGVNFLIFSEGGHFGEIEVVENTVRTCFAQTKTSCLMMLCKKEDFINILKEFPAVETELMDMLKKRKEKIKISKPKTLRKRPSETVKWQLDMKRNRKTVNYLKSTDYFISNILKMKSDKLSLKLKKNKLFPENQRESLKGGGLDRKRTLESIKSEGINVFRKLAKSIKSVLRFKRILSVGSITPVNSQPAVTLDSQNKPAQTNAEAEPNNNQNANNNNTTSTNTNNNNNNAGSGPAKAVLSKKNSLMIDSPSSQNPPLKGILSKKSSMMVEKKLDEIPEHSNEPTLAVPKKFDRKSSRKKSTKKSEKVFTFNEGDGDNQKMTKANDIREVHRNIKELEELEAKKVSIQNEIKFSILEIQREFEQINNRQIEIDKLLEEYLTADKNS